MKDICLSLYQQRSLAKCFYWSHHLFFLIYIITSMIVSYPLEGNILDTHMLSYMSGLLMWGVGSIFIYAVLYNICDEIKSKEAEE